LVDGKFINEGRRQEAVLMTGCIPLFPTVISSYVVFFRVYSPIYIFSNT
jgi:hypothetical protein